MHYWQDSDDDKTQLIVVTNEAVYAQKMDEAACQRQIGELNAGKSPATVFGKDATHVVLRSISKVQRSSSDEDIDFVLRDGKDEKTESVTIQDEGVRAEVFSAVERVTEGRFKLYEDHYSSARNAYATLVMLTIFGFGSKTAASAAVAIRSAEEIDIEGRKQGLKQLIVWVLDVLGPTGVWAIGGTICVLLLWALFNQIKAPPLMQILQADPYKPQSPIVTVLKYLALAAVWVVFMPLMFR